MEVDQDEKRLRPNSYGPLSTSQRQLMQQSDPGSHSYLPPSGSGSTYGAGPMGWAPPPSPFAHEPRQTSEVSQLSNTYQPPSRENTYGPEAPYVSRSGSISAPTRSPCDGTVQSHLHHVNPPPADGPYQPPQAPSDYRNRAGYPPPDVHANGSHPTGLHLATGQEVMPAQQAFIHTSHGPYSHPPSTGLGPGPSPVYESFYHGQHWSTTINRKKPVRAQQACDACRARKAKCDEGRPCCSHCKDNALTCTYREIPPHKQDRNAQALEAKIDSMQRELTSLQQEMGSLQRATNDKLDKILQLYASARSHTPMLPAGLPPESCTSITPAIQHQATWESSRAPATQIQPGVVPTVAPTVVNSVNVNSEEMNTLPHNHTTAAQNLFLWPSIAAFGLESDPDYVVLLEEGRGVLRLYGRGEGHDKMDGCQGPESPAHSSSSARTDDSPSPPAESLWGFGFRPPYPYIQGDHPGGLNPDGSPNYAPELVDKYYESYIRHMYILHPFLDKKAIKDHINQFKSRYSRERPGAMRKRKHEQDNPLTPAQDSHYLPVGNQVIGVERSVRNAIVLLVLALGMVCDHKAPLPASPPTPSTAPFPALAPTPRSSNSDPYSPSPTSPYQPYQPLGPRSRVSVASIADRVEPERNNVDVIPGLAYYNVACDILGGLRGGYDLSHVQAALLAGLYMGQIGRVISSHDWITQAGKACQVLINPKKFPGGKQDRYLDLVKYAYWSCLQLESDILAELPLPQSGVSRYETFMNNRLPSGIQFSEEEHSVYKTDQRVKAIEVIYYWAQIQLRITLNSVHHSLYDKNAPKLQPSVQKSLMENLEAWRKLTHERCPELAWDDDDYLTSDINAARMRAKYYGAKYIISRPTLAAALHEDWSKISVWPSEAALPGQGHASQQSSPTLPHRRHSAAMQKQDGYIQSPIPHEMPSVGRLKPEIYEGVKTCIHAAIRSTTAFDGVPQRLIVTNIFGTGHAQFGNMLVLSATYNSYLRPLIDGKELQSLFTRTIEFLGNAADISPPLMRDMQHLKRLEAQLFPKPAHLGMTSSFSSG